MINGISQKWDIPILENMKGKPMEALIREVDRLLWINGITLPLTTIFMIIKNLGMENTQLIDANNIAQIIIPLYSE